MRRIGLIAVLSIFGSTCAARSRTAREEMQQRRGPDLHLRVMISPAYVKRLEGSVPVPVFSSTKVEVRSPDGGLRSVGTVRADDGGSATAELVAAGWASGPGTHSLVMSSEQVDGGSQELRAEIDLRGTELRVEGFAWMSATPAKIEIDLTIVDRAPPTLRLEQKGVDPGTGLPSYELHNSGDGSVFFRGEKTPHAVLEVLQNGAWLRLAADATCMDPFAVHEQELPAGKAVPVETGAQACWLTALPPGRYRHLVEALPAIPPPAWETYDLPVEVDRVIEVESMFTIESRELGKRFHVFPDVPLRDLRQIPTVKTEKQLGALVIAPDGRVACACLGARIGSEAHVAVPGTGDMCVAPEPHPSIETCEPLHELDSARWRKPVGDFPPFPPGRDAW